MVLIYIVIFLIFFVLFMHIKAIVRFKETKNYIKMEMKRSPNERIARFWKRELKILYLKSIPIIGRFIK